MRPEDTIPHEPLSGISDGDDHGLRGLPKKSLGIPNSPLHPAEKSPKLKIKKVLIVQADWEAGMRRLAQDLQDMGHQVGKVAFCFCDLFYAIHGIKTHAFRNPIGEFHHWLTELVEKEGYDTFFLYNHYRPYNQVAWNLACDRGIDCHVFELGLLRPNFITVFDRDHTPIDAIRRSWQTILESGNEPDDIPPPTAIARASTPWKVILMGLHYLLSRLTLPLFPNFIDQRDMNLWYHFKHGVIHVWRYLDRTRDLDMDRVFAGEWSKSYYVAPLQVHSDTQISENSDFQSIEEFIETVVDSFARHAPKDTKLVFKVHPMDRGYKDYHDLITELDYRLGGGRLVYVDRVHLPNLLNHALGLVNINSTVGLSGLIHHLPVIALGHAVYDLPKLTYQGDLDSFWREAKPVEKRWIRQFVKLLLNTNQAYGMFSQRCFDVEGRCRIQWPQPFARKFFLHQSFLANDRQQTLNPSISRETSLMPEIAARETPPLSPW